MSSFATSNAGRAILGVGTFGLSEGGGIRPIIQGITGKDPVAQLLNVKTKTPQPPGVVAAPATDSPAVQQAGANAGQAAASRRGFASTILSLMTQRATGPRTTLGS